MDELEQHLNHLAQLIYAKISDSKKLALDDIKSYIRAINTH